MAGKSKDLSEQENSHQVGNLQPSILYHANNMIRLEQIKPLE
jgi:hypothetical protein